ncbi:MAG: hypothetical protein GY765_22220 [bacterium]|nr:hypothetical protein [bacterium]
MKKLNLKEMKEIKGMKGGDGIIPCVTDYAGCNGDKCYIKVTCLGITTEFPLTVQEYFDLT